MEQSVRAACHQKVLFRNALVAFLHTSPEITPKESRMEKKMLNLTMSEDFLQRKKLCLGDQMRSEFFFYFKLLKVEILQKLNLKCFSQLMKF